MIKSVSSSRAASLRKSSSKLMAAAAALAILSVASAMVHAQSSGVPEAGAQVTAGDRIDQLFSGNPATQAAPERNGSASPPPRSTDPVVPIRPVQAEGQPLGLGGGQVVPMGASSPAPSATSPPWGAPPQSSSSRPALVPRPSAPSTSGQASPGASSVTLATPSSNAGQSPPASPAPAIEVEVQPSNEINLTEEDAVRQIETLNRQRRVLETQRHVEAERLAIYRTIQDLRKVMNESRAVAPQVSAFQEPAAPVPVVPNSASGQVPAGVLERASETADPISQMAVLSIAGPVERLVATVRVQGFGNMQVRTGSTLPGNVRVVSVEGRGITVRSATGSSRLLPFGN